MFQIHNPTSMGMEQTVDKVAPLKVRQEEDFIDVATRTESERLMKVGGCDDGFAGVT